MARQNRLIAMLLHYANSSRPTQRTEFYALKRRLLERYGAYVGDDIQHIVKECWGRYPYDEGHIPCGPTCRKCGGTGIFAESWHVLRRYEWCGYVFHVPNHRLYSAPESPVTITGRIEHRDVGRAGDEAALWLYLLCGEWSLFWRSLRASRVCGWTWWPLLNVQKVAMELSMRLHRQKCWCGKWFWTWGSGWQICKACRKPRVSSDDVPF